MRPISELADELGDRIVAGPNRATRRHFDGKDDGASHSSKHRPAGRPARRYGVAALLNGLIAVTFVALANRGRCAHHRIVTRANLLTLSRAGAAALLSGTAASPGLGRRTAWLALLWGGPSDWLDGPLARRDGVTELGALLDIEADSWLTLWAAIAAWRIGELPWWSVAPPVLRYVIPAVQARDRPPRPLDRPWQRVAASLQTLALTLALAPAQRLNRVGRVIAPVGAIAQVAALASTIRELRRREPLSARVRRVPGVEDPRSELDRASA